MLDKAAKASKETVAAVTPISILVSDITTEGAALEGIQETVAEAVSDSATEIMGEGIIGTLAAGTAAPAIGAASAVAGTYLAAKEINNFDNTLDDLGIKGPAAGAIKGPVGSLPEVFFSAAAATRGNFLGGVTNILASDISNKASFGLFHLIFTPLESINWKAFRQGDKKEAFKNFKMFEHIQGVTSQAVLETAFDTAAALMLFGFGVTIGFGTPFIAAALTLLGLYALGSWQLSSSTKKSNNMDQEEGKIFDKRIFKGAVKLVVQSFKILGYAALLAAGGLFFVGAMGWPLWVVGAIGGILTSAPEILFMLGDFKKGFGLKQKIISGQEPEGTKLSENQVQSLKEEFQHARASALGNIQTSGIFNKTIVAVAMTGFGMWANGGAALTLGALGTGFIAVAAAFAVITAVTSVLVIASYMHNKNDLNKKKTKPLNLSIR